MNMCMYFICILYVFYMYFICILYVFILQRNGSQVAIKVFDSTLAQHHVTKAWQRETQLLRSTRHKNIIKLLACETEVSHWSW